MKIAVKGNWDLKKAFDIVKWSGKVCIVGGRRAGRAEDSIKIPFPLYLYLDRVIKGNCKENMCDDLLYNDPGWLFDSSSLRGISRFLTTYKSNYKNDRQ